MSHDATAWAKAQKTGSSPAKFILLVLADFAGTDYSCYPSVKKLAEITELGESTVREATRKLAEGGLIRVFYRYRANHTRRSSRYQLLVDGVDTMEPDAEDWAHHRQEPADIRQEPAHSQRQEPALIPPTEPSLREPSLATPGASRSEEVVTGEIVDDNVAPAVAVGAALEVAGAPNAGQLTRRWIDYCASKDVKLTTSVIKRYGATVRRAMSDGFDENLIRRALAAMLTDRVASRPALLDNYLIRVQQGPELPPERLSAHQADAERRAAAAGSSSAAARLYDTLTRDA